MSQPKKRNSAEQRHKGKESPMNTSPAPSACGHSQGHSRISTDDGYATATTGDGIWKDGKRSTAPNIRYIMLLPNFMLA